MSEGDTLDEVRRNIRDAVDLYLSPDPVPFPPLMGGGWLFPALMMIAGGLTLWTMLSGPRRPARHR